jgi:hypothetical protein
MSWTTEDVSTSWSVKMSSTKCRYFLDTTANECWNAKEQREKKMYDGESSLHRVQHLRMAVTDPQCSSSFGKQTGDCGVIQDKWWIESGVWPPDLRRGLDRALRRPWTEKGFPNRRLVAARKQILYRENLTHTCKQKDEGAVILIRRRSRRDT